MVDPKPCYNWHFYKDVCVYCEFFLTYLTCKMGETEKEENSFWMHLNFSQDILSDSHQVLFVQCHFGDGVCHTPVSTFEEQPYCRLHMPLAKGFESRISTGTKEMVSFKAWQCIQSTLQKSRLISYFAEFPFLFEVVHIH